MKRGALVLERVKMSREFLELWKTCVGWGKLFAPNEAGIQAFLKFYGVYVHHKK